MIARRGLPEVIHCDNGRSFLKADAQIKRLYDRIDWAKIRQYGVSIPQRIEFRFNPPLAPHQGGAWERMVQSMKRALYRAIKSQLLTLEEFRTALCSAEAVVNARPLYNISSDCKDSAPITPAHLAIGRSLQMLPESWAMDKPGNPTDIQWEERQKVQKHFWYTWRSYYLNTLHPFDKWETEGRVPRVGEVVVLKDSTLPKHTWPLAIIREIHESPTDHVPRSVTVSTGFRRESGQPVTETLYRRDVRNIAPLEARREVDPIMEESNLSDE
jgi:hypothetical protein